MKLDGKYIAVGSSVWDLAMGTGVVVAETAGIGVSVEFATGQQMSYNALGVGQFTNKTLYTSPPHLFAPLGAKQDFVFSRISKAIYESFQGLLL
jgi:hypothetical protein